MGKMQSGEMFSPNEVGEYMPHEDTAQFTGQGLMDALTTVESTEIKQLCPLEEYVMQLEVMMVDWPG